jgi:hypothetical protein
MTGSKQFPPHFPPQFPYLDISFIRQIDALLSSKQNEEGKGTQEKNERGMSLWGGVGGGGGYSSSVQPVGNRGCPTRKGQYSGKSQYRSF